MMQNRAQRLLGGWVLVVVGVTILLGGISLYAGSSDAGSRLGGFLGTLAGVLVVLWGYGVVLRTRMAYLDDHLDSVDRRLGELERRGGGAPPEDPRGP